ncbi:SUMF1/EgtB/PvdO family nonheme iron enzyme [Sorangium sp. So ce260]|uniref:SUMF1/EgtB/PvdO family nonheme iron enzyme n=1 Tax=Sorangium sp. So ce260 TaxID=3133291 RepID=UPI003F640EAD
MAVNVFISYAPADRPHLEALEARLAALKRQGLVSTWHRGRIGAGAARDEAIAAALSAAEVVVLLVSEAFLDSDSCYEQELGAALERHRRGAARVLPILVRACDREGTALAALQALPRDGGAVTSWANPDEAWMDVVRGIRAAVEEAAASARPEAGLAGAALTSALAATLREAEEAIRAIDKQIAAAQKRRLRLKAAGASTAEVDQEIVDLRRKRREGGQLHVGEELSEGRYLLLERIGRGGFATVWRALDAGRGDRPVAIKVLHPNLAGDDGRRERFFRGARAMAELDHPGVVRILEPKGEDGGWHYFVMELVHGEDVHSAVIGKRLPAERVIPMLLRAGEAISFAHGRGLVHRDVKPANILLDTEGLPRITDFDLVWARDTTGGTRSGALGTFLYAAPELMHRPQDADARADVYGLGMTAVFCLHGGELPPIMMRYPGRVIERLPCSDAVRKVLERAIEFEASERYPDVAAFCEALRSAAAGEGSASPEAAEGPTTERGAPLEAAEGPTTEPGGLLEAAEGPATERRGLLKATKSVRQPKFLAGWTVRQDLKEGGPVGDALREAILRPRAARPGGPVKLTVVDLDVNRERTIVSGNWSLLWPKPPVPGPAEAPFEERGSFRCTLPEKPGSDQAPKVTYQSDFFESLLTWVDIPDGTFLMGSPDEDPEAHRTERPQRQVAVEAFTIAATPVTVGQYAAVTGQAAREEEANRPICNLSWQDAIEFCNALSWLTGRQPCYLLTLDRLAWVHGADGFRLPREAEWEYACRAGTTTRYFFGDDEHRLADFAWYRENSENRAAPVGRKMPNPWNLYDMHGNVWEWTWDEYHGLDKTASPDARLETAAPHTSEIARTVRGGSFIDSSKWLRSARRIGYQPKYQNEHLGFRCAGPARRKP